MNIIITGITSFRNHGVEALVTTTIDQLRKRLPNPQFEVFDRAPEYDSSRITDKDVRFIYDHTARPLYSTKLRQMLIQMSHYYERIDGNYQDTLKILKKGSCVIASGGDVFSSDYGTRSLQSHLRPLELAIDAGIPVFFLAQSIGPFKNSTDASAFAKVAEKAASITVREKYSYNYVVKELGLPAKLVTHTADPAFLLRRPSAEVLEKAHSYYHMGKSRPTIALATSQAICNWSNADYDLHFRVWIEVIQMLIDEMKAQVILIPHVQEISVKNDDRVLATDLLRHFKFNPQVQLAGGDFSASEFKGIISGCDMVVAERMHAALAGLSSAVCTVAVGYSIKAEGILSDLFEPDLVKNSLLLPLKDFLIPELAKKRISEAWKNRQSIHTQLKTILPEIQKRAAQSFDIIVETLSK